MSTRPSPRTFRRLRMRDIHVICGFEFKNRLLLKWSQCKQTRLERRRQQGRERRARETPEERDRRRSLRNQRDRERKRARCAAETPQERDGRLERDRQRSRERRVLLQVILRDSSAFFEVIHHKCKLIGQTKTDPSLSDPFPCAY